MTTPVWRSFIATLTHWHYKLIIIVAQNAVTHIQILNFRSISYWGQSGDIYEQSINKAPFGGLFFNVYPMSRTI